MLALSHEIVSARARHATIRRSSLSLSLCLSLSFLPKSPPTTSSTTPATVASVTLDRLTTTAPGTSPLRTAVRINRRGAGRRRKQRRSLCSQRVPTTLKWFTADVTIAQRNVTELRVYNCKQRAVMSFITKYVSSSPPFSVSG